MTLLADVVDYCEQRNVRVALIGAAAMTVYGVSRTTFDTDLLTVDRTALHVSFWAAFADAVDVRKGDFDDPLAGVVRIKRAGERTVDIVVAKYKFQAAVLSRATPMNIAGGLVPVVQASDLVLLKLFAGGPKDLLDIEMLLQADRALLVHVEQHLPDLPADSRRLWLRFA
ncbi:MAG: hypothetical protein ACXW31_18155 [Thermoanaerobaculia bacterium]